MMLTSEEMDDGAIVKREGIGRLRQCRGERQGGHSVGREEGRCRLGERG
jgi:hypothetical protein